MLTHILCFSLCGEYWNMVRLQYLGLSLEDISVIRRGVGVRVCARARVCVCVC